MTLPNLALILLSAVVHVVAHVAWKRARDRMAFAWWMLLWSCLLFAPVLLFERPAVPRPAWGIIAASAVFEAVYFLLIARAYRLGDLSLAYPLARGSSPLFLLIWTSLFLKDHLTPGGVGGIVLIAAGLYVINLSRLGAWLAPLRSLAQPAPQAALAAGLCISLYTFADRSGVQFLDPLFYTYLVVWFTLLLLTPVILYRVGAPGLRAELRSSRLGSVLAGFTTMVAYTLVLIVIRAGTPASYAGAIREVSVVLSSLIGVVWLHEHGSRVRVLGAFCVVAGISLIALLA